MKGLNLPFSSRHFVECLNTGAEKFGWAKRTPGVGSMKKDGLTIGWGVAGCSWIAERTEAQAAVDLMQTGVVRVSTATQDIGTGTYTALSQMASTKLGIPHDRIEVVLGDTRLPAGPISGGSWATASLVPAVMEAIEKAKGTLFAVAGSAKGTQFDGAKPDALAFTDGRVHLKDTSPDTGVPFEEILNKANIRVASGAGKLEGDLRRSE